MHSEAHLISNAVYLELIFQSHVRVFQKLVKLPRRKLGPITWAGSLPEVADTADTSFIVLCHHLASY